MSLNVNGRTHAAQAPEETTLLVFLRDFLRLTWQPSTRGVCRTTACLASKISLRSKST